MASATPSGFETSGFFVLRTPLLAFDELSGWSDGLQAPVAHASGADLERALTADRALLTERLRDAWRRPELREAIFLASPELDAALQRSETPADTSDGGARALRSFVAYFARMTARATPFGLFAGCSVGTLDAQTALELVPTADYQRHTRLDMDYLTALVSALEADPSVRATLRYAPNSSLYPAGGRLHYAESRLGKHGRSYHLVALEDTPELVRTLASAAGGATLDALSSGLVDDTVSPVEAREFVDEVASSQILVSDLGPQVTGEEAIHALIARLASHTQTQPVADCQARVRDDLAASIEPGWAVTRTPGTRRSMPAWSHCRARPNWRGCSRSTWSSPRRGCHSDRWSSPNSRTARHRWHRVTESESPPESGVENIFRDEALDFVARLRGPGELMRVSVAWTDWAFWSLFGLIGVGLAAAMLVRISDEPLLYVLVPALRTLIERLHA